MVTPINLNQARKRRARLAADAAAVENRVKFGRSKVERATAKLAGEAAVKKLDGHKRDATDQD